MARQADAVMPLWSGRGQLVVTQCLDGRVLLRLEDGTKSGMWLELMASDVLWLIDVLMRTTSCQPTAAAGVSWEPYCDDG